MPPLDKEQLPRALLISGQGKKSPGREVVAIVHDRRLSSITKASTGVLVRKAAGEPRRRGVTDWVGSGHAKGEVRTLVDLPAGVQS